MCAKPAVLRRSLPQRFALLAFVVALLIAPLLVNVWPALGKGPMLVVASDVATQVDHSAHARHHDHDAGAAQGPHASHPTTEHDESHHQQHCALCVLAFLGWAPPIDLVVACAPSSAADRAPPLADSTPRVPLLWRNAQARAPPLAT